MAKAILGPFEVSETEIMRLEQDQLVKLVLRLVQADIHRHSIPQSAVQGTLRITVPDGGEDVRVEWSGLPLRTNFVPRPFTVLQVKAETLTVDKVRNEPIEGKGKAAQLKPAVGEVIARLGAYVIVSNRTNVTTPLRGKSSGIPKKPKQDQLRAALRTSIDQCSPTEGVEIDFYGPPKLRDWVNQNPMIAVWVKQQLGQAAADFPFQTIDDWSTYADVRNKFIPCEEISAQITTIRETLASKGEVIRLMGHSGLGKSRLVFEALKPTPTNLSTDLGPLVAYAKRPSAALVHHIHDFVHNTNRVILVVDECPPEEHRQLSEEVHRTGSQLSLISLDLEFKAPPPSDRTIVIKQLPAEVVRAILEDFGIGGSRDDVERATEFCSGFPLIAVLVARALKGGAQHFADFQDHDRVVERLVWGRGVEDHKLLRILRAIALFDAVGIQPPKDDQGKWIVEHLIGIPQLEFETSLDQFENRRILQCRGYSVLVSPRPLAAQLAASFWRRANPREKALLLSGTMPDELKEALCERLSDLNYLSDARAVAAQLCEQNGPFGSAEALNTETGARCLRKLAEVAPEEVVAALERAFDSWPIPRVRAELGPGRRWAVWTLEAAAWEPTVFCRASRLLLRLGAGENETWSNNASNEFAQLFRVQLPGTSASLAQRMDCLLELFANAEAEEIPVLLEALGNAIDSRGGTRVLGSERHGTRKTYEDHRPKLWDEIFDYARGALIMIRQIAEQYPNEIDRCRGAVAEADPNYLLAVSVLPEYEATIRALTPPGETWGKLLQTLSWTLRHRVASADIEVQTQIRRLIDGLMPKTLSQRILFFVKDVPFHFEEPGVTEKFSFEAHRRRAAALGQEAANDWEALSATLRPLSRGNTREGFSFGKGLFLASADRRRALNLAISELIAGSDDTPNASVLAGMIAALWEAEESDAEQIVSEIGFIPKLKQFLPYLASIRLTEGLLSQISTEIRVGMLPPSAAMSFTLGGVLTPLPSASVRELVDALRSTGTEGCWVALDILGMYAFDDSQKFLEMRVDIDRLLRTPNMLTLQPDQTLADYHFEMLAKKLLADDEFGPRLAVDLSNALISTKGVSADRNNSLCQQILTHLMTEWPNIALPIFANVVEKSSPSERWHLSFLLGSPFSFEGKEKGPLFSVSTDLLLEECRKNSKNFLVLVAQIAPLFHVEQDGSRVWTALALAFLDEFGKRRDVLKAMSSNLGSGGWMGPTSAYLETFISPLNALKKHKHAAVRQWAGQKVTQLRAQVDREIRDEEEESLRRG